MRSVVSVRLSFCFHSFVWTNWPLTLMCVGRDHSRWGIESKDQEDQVKVRWRSKVGANTCVPHDRVSTAASWVLIDGRSSRFPLWRHQLRASVARRGAGRPRSAAAAESSVYGRGNAVGLTSILHWRQFFIVTINSTRHTAYLRHAILI